MAVPRSISSNCTSLSYAREREGVTPQSLTWILLDPSAYTGDFGSTPDYITAETVGSGRAPQKGRPSGKTVGAQFESYMRQNELQPFLPGFFINHPIETASTNQLRPVTAAGAVTTSPPTLASVELGPPNAYVGTNFTAANGFDTSSGNDSPIVFASGFGNLNDGVKFITTISATKVQGTGLVAQDPVPSTAALQTCGYVTDDTLPAITVSGGQMTIASANLKKTGLMELPPGTFIHIGGDSNDSRIDASDSTVNTGWARIKETTSTGVVCDLTTFSPTANPATGRSGVQVYIPTRIFKDDIQCGADRVTTYAFERRLGHADTNTSIAPHEQSQLVTGSFPNQLDLAMPTDDAIKATMQFMSRESYRRDGKTDQAAPWTYNATPPNDRRAKNDKTPIYNTTTDIKHALLYRHDASTPNRTQVFGLITDGTFTLNNNAKELKGWGVYGAWDINPGYLMVDTQVTALFTTTEALDLSEDGIEAGLFVIFARNNAGFILDVPLVTVKSSALSVEQGEAVSVSITNEGNESDFGYAASLQFFDYLPNLATAIRRNI